MFLNDFSVRVIGGKETSGAYVEMNHGANYKLALRNARGVACDARVEVDGKHVGTWRIDPNQTVTLERPAHDHGKFTFYKQGTGEASAAGLEAGDPNLGLVKVTFTPEMPRPVITVTDPGYWQWHPYPWKPASPIYSVPCTYTCDSLDIKGIAPTANATYVAATASASQLYEAGGTGLSGHSQQEYGQAGTITYDYSQQTVIHLRLVAGHRSEGPRPLTAYSTPVPPAIG